MTALVVHGRKVETVFELLGENENAMTYSLGWALSKCPSFCFGFANLLGIESGFSENMHIRLQDYGHDKGYTDIELIDPARHHVIVEAKRGFIVPSDMQLEKYADRLLANADAKAKRVLVVLAESDRDESWLQIHSPTSIKDISVLAITWRRFQEMARQATKSATHEEKRLLGQLTQFLAKVTSMQNQTSNRVYVVSLSDGKFTESDVTFIDVVEKFQKYFHPVGGGKGGWPIEPPNYIAFRYRGELQSIHHVDAYTVIDNFYPHFPVPENSKADRPLYLYDLGPSIKPPKPTPTNDPSGISPKIMMSSRRWCDLDLLLTCNSVAEAAKISRDRDAFRGEQSVL
jgi:hypothetical protein